MKCNIWVFTTGNFVLEALSFLSASHFEKVVIDTNTEIHVMPNKEKNSDYMCVCKNIYFSSESETF